MARIKAVEAEGYIKRARVSIVGVSPLLMHAFPIEPVVGLEKKTPKEQAEVAAYRGEDGVLYFPGVNIQRALVSAAAFSKGGGRTTLQKQVAACVLVTPERISLGMSDYAIDSRAVVIAATRGRIVRHRPRLDTWSMTFVIEYDNTLLSETQMRKVLDDAGSRCGIGDFRPEKKGPFGRFRLLSWEY